MDISERGLALVEQFEGGQSSDGLFHAYFDRFGGVWTIGYGETEGVHSGMTWTKAQAEADLRSRMRREYEPAVKQYPWLNQNQFDALCSLAWNCGPGVLGAGHSMGDALRAGNVTAASRAFMVYTRSGGAVLQGLVNRREAEQRLFNTPATPPVGYHYERYSTEPVRLPNGVHVEERPTVEEYDRLIAHPRRNAARIKVLRAHMRVFMRLIASRATADSPPNWHKASRQWRWRRLSDRQTGKATLTL